MIWNSCYRIGRMEDVNMVEDGELKNSDHDEILDAAITYKIDGTYPSEALKDRKRAIRKRAERLEIDKGELFFLRKNGQKVKIITDPAEQKRILEACHSDFTSGHFGVTKTCKRLTERFYWRGITKQAKDLVSYICALRSACARLHEQIILIKQLAS